MHIYLHVGNRASEYVCYWAILTYCHLRYITIISKLVFIKYVLMIGVIAIRYESARSLLGASQMSLLTHKMLTQYLFS